MYRDYNGFDYTADYEFILYQNGLVVEGPYRDDRAACFGKVFNTFGGRDDEIFLGVYTIHCRKDFEEDSGNFCALDKIQILKILRYMRKEFGIKIQLSETKDKYTFTFHIQGKPIKHKFILTFSRIFFEYPYNELAVDVMKLRAKGVVDGINFSHKSFLELYHLVCMSIREGWFVHSLFTYPVVGIKAKTMHEQFELGLHCVCDVYIGSEAVKRKLNQCRREDQDWVNGFEDRVTRYSENFKTLKQLKYEKQKGVRRRARKVL